MKISTVLGSTVVVIIVVLMVLLAHVQDRASQSEIAAPSPQIEPTGNIQSDQLRARPAAEQAALLGKSAGCIGVEAFYDGVSADKIAIWSVRCSDSHSYLVTVQPDAEGTAKGLDCDFARTTLHLNVGCFEKF